MQKLSSDHLTARRTIWTVTSRPVCTKVMQVLKGPSEVTAFSLFCPCEVQGTDRVPETLISLGRDSYTHTRRHKHTQSGGSEPFVAGSWSTDLTRC